MLTKAMTAESVPSLWMRFVAGFRIVTTRLVVLALAGLMLVSEHTWSEESIVDFVLEFIGLLLVCVGTFGRLWCTLYAGGRKDRQLVTDGPYSIVRNPLYVFSFLGAVGVAMSTESLTFAALVAMLFALYYPYVVANEERRLQELFGEQFSNYCKRVPRFIPNLRLFNEGTTVTFNPALFRKACLDASWFFVAYGAVSVIEHLHLMKVLPVYIRLP